VRARGLVVALGILFARGAAAQRHAVVGRVTDTLGVPLPGAQVWVDGKPRAVANDSGRFAVRGLDSASFYLVAVKRLGYAELAAALAPDSGTVVRAEFQLAPNAQQLSTVRVVGKGETGIPDFDRNRRTGRGYYLDRAAIEARNPLVATDLLTMAPWVQVRGGMNRQVLGRRSGRSCQMSLMVNGFLRAIGDDVTFDDWAGPIDQIEAVEVYARSADVPGQYIRDPDMYQCGLVVVWTRLAVEPSRAGRAEPARKSPEH
jgi:hypothetical protein